MIKYLKRKALGFVNSEVQSMIANAVNQSHPYSFKPRSDASLPLIAAMSGVYKNDKRDFKAADLNRLTSDLNLVTGTSGNEEIRAAHCRLVAIARNLENNSDYTSGYLSIIENNVVGAKGIRLQVLGITSRQKKLDTVNNQKIEASFTEWSKKGNCTVCGRYSFKDVQRLMVRQEARDGEIFIRKVKGFSNKWGFALEIIETDSLDINYGYGEASRINKNNKIYMAIEFDGWNRPQAYHVSTNRNNLNDYVYFDMQGAARIPFPANEMIHFFTSRRASQVRGIPHLTTAMLRLNNLGALEEAALVAARVGASQMGFFTKEKGQQTGNAVIGQKKDAAGNLLTECEPGIFHELPEGMDFKPFAPDFPAESLDVLLTRQLKGVARGTNSPYEYISKDLKGVNLSSIRVGIMEARDEWETKQVHLVDYALDDIYSNWLSMSIMTDLSGVIKPSQYTNYLKTKWQPRGWEYVNPVQGAKADMLAVQMGKKTLTDIAAESGSIYADNIVKISEELKFAKEKEVPISFMDANENESEVNQNAFTKE